MKCTAFAVSLSLASSLAAAQVNPQDHEAHHPEGAASAPAASGQATKPAAAAPENFEQQIQMMQDMHKRMQAARSPAERQALMAEQMNLMQSGMAMMGKMGMGMGMGMGGMGAPGMPAAAASAPGTTQPNPQGMQGMAGMMGMHGAMERRMAMMEQVMQMMVDREAVMPRR